MNINFGLLPPLSGKSRGRGKRLLLAKRALKEMEEWKKKNEG
jgi:folate-dependent tRNA-U54 methylase TrmFO/GidA